MTGCISYLSFGGWWDEDAIMKTFDKVRAQDSGINTSSREILGSIS